MSCEHYIEAIGEDLDGTLEPEARRTLEAHLAGCAECRQAAADLRRIREAATALPERTPPARVWARIADEIERAAPASVPSSTPEPTGAPRAGWLRFVTGHLAPVPLLAAAVVLLAVTAGYLALGRGAPGLAPSPAPVASEPAAGHAETDLVRSVQEELQLAESHYERAIAGLEQIMQSGHDTLDPQVAATLQKNMSLIDQAISDSREALRSQPTSQLAQESLFEAFRRKVALLQDTVALINEMRKGNEAGAAKIIGNLNKS